MDYIRNKVIVITGAGSGFGRLVASKTAAAGAKVVCADINADAVTETVTAIEANGGQSLAVQTDVTDLAAMHALVQAAIDRYQSVDVMINNAGTMPLAFIADHAKAAEAWSRCIDINIKGVLNGIIAAYDPMIAQGSGQLINISSIYGNYPVTGAAVYGATKAAVNFISESLRQESLGKIKVTTVKPTGIPTTGLANSIINFDAGAGIMGPHAENFAQRFGQIMEGSHPPEWTDPERIEYLSMDPEHLAEQIIYAINQPLGVSIGEITVRASGDVYMI